MGQGIEVWRALLGNATTRAVVREESEGHLAKLLQDGANATVQTREWDALLTCVAAGLMDELAQGAVVTTTGRMGPTELIAGAHALAQELGLSTEGSPPADERYARALAMVVDERLAKSQGRA